MNVTRRTFGKLTCVGAAMLTMAPLTLLEACSQDSIAALVQILGTTGASIENILGNAEAAATFTKDTATAVAQVKAWKSGTPAQMAIEALNLLATDYTLIPGINVDPTVAALVALGIGTIDSILALLPQSATLTLKASYHRRHVQLNKAPTTAKEFKDFANSLINSSAEPKWKALELK